MSVSKPAKHGRDHQPGGEDPIPFGPAIYEIKVFEDENVVIVGDGLFLWPIPDSLDEALIVYADAGVSTVSSSGPVEIQLAHQVGGAGGFSDILTTKISIAAGAKNATPGVVTDDAWEVANGDWLRIDVDAAGSGAKGLVVMVGLMPSRQVVSELIKGKKGDPGGVTDWEGPWQTATSYQAGDVVNVGGTSYVALVDHVSSAASEPGVGVDWEDFWMVLAGGHTVSELVAIISGQNFAIDPGLKLFVPVYFACTIVEATLLGDIAGDAVVDIWKDTYGNYPPTNADSITAAAPLTLSGAAKTTDTTLTGWTTSIAAGDVLAFNVDSCSVIRLLTVGLKVERT